MDSNCSRRSLFQKIYLRKSNKKFNSVDLYISFLYVALTQSTDEYEPS